MTLRGHYDGTQVVLDEPVPADIPPHTPVEVIFGNDRGEAAPPVHGSLSQRLLQLAGAAGDGLPEDLARNHDHYLHGQERR